MEAKLSVRQLVDVVNDLLGSVYENILVEGEVASFKVNQDKYVFFDLKDPEDGTTVNVFMMKHKLTAPTQDGMRVMVRGYPRLTDWGKFSFTATAVQPVGEGNIKKAFEILRAKLEKEGLFDEERKKPLPDLGTIGKIGVVSSTGAAGFMDFIKIVNERRGGLKIVVANTAVQGVDAPLGIIQAIYRLDSLGLDAIAIVRGGGSADDLAAFNDEALARAIASSKTPIVTGIGHETDTSLADLAADVRASTPSNAAQFLTFDMRQEAFLGEKMLAQIKNVYVQKLYKVSGEAEDVSQGIYRIIMDKLEWAVEKVLGQMQTIEAMNPEVVLRKGYALVRGEIDVGSVVEVETIDKIIKAEVKNISRKRKGKI